MKKQKIECPSPAPRMALVHGMCPTSLFRIPHFTFSQAGFSLVEVVIAVGIFSFVIVAILGTMTVALNSTRDSEMKLGVTHAAAAIIGNLKANPTNIADANFTNSSVTNLATLSGIQTNTSTNHVDRQGRHVEASDPNAAFRLKWKLVRNTGATDLTNLVLCNLELSWPPGTTNNVSSHRVATSILLP